MSIDEAMVAGNDLLQSVDISNQEGGSHTVEPGEKTGRNNGAFPRAINHLGKSLRSKGKALNRKSNVHRTFLRHSCESWR